MIVAKNATTTKHGAIAGKTQTHYVEQYNLDAITVSEHISNILESGELDETSVGFSDKSTGVESQKFTIWI